jgi:hypothetical protein
MPVCLKFELHEMRRRLFLLSDRKTYLIKVGRGLSAHLKLLVIYEAANLKRVETRALVWGLPVVFASF